MRNSSKQLGEFSTVDDVAKANCAEQIDSERTHQASNEAKDKLGRGTDVPAGMNLKFRMRLDPSARLYSARARLAGAWLRRSSPAEQMKKMDFQTLRAGQRQPGDSRIESFVACSKSG